MKTLKEIRLDYIRTVLEDCRWDFGRASRILKVSESRLHREARGLSGLSMRQEGAGPSGTNRKDKKK